VRSACPARPVFSLFDANLIETLLLLLKNTLSEAAKKGIGDFLCRRWHSVAAAASAGVPLRGVFWATGGKARRPTAKTTDGARIQDKSRMKRWGVQRACGWCFFVYACAGALRGGIVAGSRTRGSGASGCFVLCSQARAAASGAHLYVARRAARARTTPTHQDGQQPLRTRVTALIQEEVVRSTHASVRGDQSARGHQRGKRERPDARQEEDEHKRRGAHAKELLAVGQGAAVDHEGALMKGKDVDPRGDEGCEDEQGGRVRDECERDGGGGGGQVVDAEVGDVLAEAAGGLWGCCLRGWLVLMGGWVG